MVLITFVRICIAVDLSVGSIYYVYFYVCYIMLLCMFMWLKRYTKFFFFLFCYPLHNCNLKDLWEFTMHTFVYCHLLYGTHLCGLILDGCY